MDNARGKVYNPDRNRQLKDYSELRWDKITPTDLDGIVDYKDRAWILFEYKYSDAKLPYGQRLMFERVSRDLGKEKPTLVIIARHLQAIEQGIDCANAEVTEICQNGKFATLAEGYTVKALADKFLHELNDMKLPVIQEQYTGMRCGLSGQRCWACRYEYDCKPCKGSTGWGASE